MMHQKRSAVRTVGSFEMSLVNVAAVCASLFAPAMAFATEGVWTLTQDTVLTEDHYGTIRPNGWRLDCDISYTIRNGSQGKDCANGTMSCGINLQNSSYSSIRACAVEDFDVGIYGDGGSAVDIDGGWIWYNGKGILLRNWVGSADTAIGSLTIASNRGVGIHLINSTDQRILYNSIYDNSSYGIYLENDQYLAYGGHYVEYNNVASNYGFGVYSRNGQYTRAYHNSIRNNGIMAHQDGLRLVACDNFDVWDNEVLGNEDTGLFVYDSYNGIVEANYGRENGYWDAYEESSVGNYWTSNTWGRTYPAGLP